MSHADFFCCALGDDKTWDERESARTPGVYGSPFRVGSAPPHCNCFAPPLLAAPLNIKPPQLSRALHYRLLPNKHQHRIARMRIFFRTTSSKT